MFAPFAPPAYMPENRSQWREVSEAKWIAPSKESSTKNTNIILYGDLNRNLLLLLLLLLLLYGDLNRNLLIQRPFQNQQLASTLMTVFAHNRNLAQPHILTSVQPKNSEKQLPTHLLEQ